MSVPVNSSFWEKTLLNSFHFLQGNDHYLSVIVVVIEGKYRNATHFFGLVKLGTDQSAEAQFKALKQRFEDDQVWTSIRKNLVALVM